MEWVIYKHTNKFNGKVYIGQTCQKPSVRWENGKGYEHNPHFYSAILKYGWNEGFTHEIIETGLATKEEANEREIYWIAFYNSYEEGYNLTKGGDNHDHLGMAVFQISMTDLSVVQKFPSLRQAAQSIMGDHTHIARCCNYTNISAYGYYWCYSEEYDAEWQPRQEKPLDERKGGKPIVQIDMSTHQVIAEFRSISQATRATGVAHSNISLCCSRQQVSAGGYYWALLEEYNEEWQPLENLNEMKKVSVYCVSTKTLYNSLNEAARATGAQPESIQRCCERRQCSAGGYLWCYPKDYSEDWRPKENNNIVAVVCYETGVVYDSIAEAARAYNTSSSNIGACCKGDRVEAAGMHWCYLKDYATFKPRKRKTTGKPVRCKETGEEYESATAAAKAKHCDNSTLSKACKMGTMAGGYHWEYI